MPRLITETIKRKKNRYNLTTEEKHNRYWRKFRTFQSLQKEFLTWCQSSQSVDKRSRILLNGRPVQTICKDTLNLKELMTLCKNNIILYENACVTNPEGVDANYMKLIIPTEMCSDFHGMFNWITRSFYSKMRVAVQLLVSGPTEIHQVFGGIREQVKFVFVYSNFFDVHLWRKFVKIFCFCVPMFFNICVYPGNDIKKTKQAVLRYCDLLKGKSKIAKQIFRTLLVYFLVKKRNDTKACEFGCDSTFCTLDLGEFVDGVLKNL